MPNSKPENQSVREHGGDLDTAIAHFGGTDWIDLSTGINPSAYPIPAYRREVFSRLPSSTALKSLERIASMYFGCSPDECLALSGAQAAIQLLPQYLKCDHVAVLGPTYNEHTASFRNCGSFVHEVSDIAECPPHAETLVLVNPNNPDGRVFSPAEILEMKPKFRNLIVDESFVDICPGNSISSHLGEPGIFVLRSFGKFFGLAGLRLGFILGNAHQIEQLRELAGPWSVNGPALALGSQAYTDDRWIAAARVRLKEGVARLNAASHQAGWTKVGGCDLFQLYDVPNAGSVQCSLARSQIWTRVFSYSDRWIRLGLPGSEEHWLRLEKALLDF